jgi:hypothetical protein
LIEDEWYDFDEKVQGGGAEVSIRDLKWEIQRA